MHLAIVGNIAQDISQSMGIDLFASVQIKGNLIRDAEHLSDICFAAGCIYIGELVINDLDQPSQSLIDAAADFLGVGLYRIGIDINRGFFQALGQEKLRVGVALTHLHSLRFFDCFVFGQLGRRI